LRLLVDTCVLSELNRPKPDPRVRARLSALDDQDIYLSVVTIGELVHGIARLVKSKRKAALAAWLTQLESLYGDRILPIDSDTARIWGQLTGIAGLKGRTIPVTDGLIAATALRHGLHVMTRNSADFDATGVMLIDPWKD